MHVFHFFILGHVASPGGRLNFSKNTEFDCSDSAQYLKKHLRNQFEILQVYWYVVSEGGQVLFWTRSEIQYGCQVAILDFCFCSISQGTYEQLILNFAHLLVHIR